MAESEMKEYKMEKYKDENNKTECTKKLYDMDAYATEFDGIVLACVEKKEKKRVCYEIILDQTMFFPEEGGQSADTGLLDGQEILDVQIKKNIITHLVSQKIEIGRTVHGAVDWRHRFYNMQQHTGEHIFSGIVHRRFGYDNVGFHLSDQTVTMDFNGTLTEDDIMQIEQDVNTCIIKNVAVEVSYPSKEILHDLSYRSKIEIDGPVRIVKIPGYDMCACCATHVKRTGEIGLLKVISFQNYKGGMRISILCGFRALEDYRQKHELVKAISNSLSVPQEAVSDASGKLKNENGQLKQKLKEEQSQRINQRIETIPEDDSNVCLFEKEIDTEVMREAVNTLMEKHQGYCGVFAGNDTDGYRYVIGSKGMDTKQLAQNLRENFKAKGGGTSDMIQGQIQVVSEKIVDYIQNLK